MPPLLSRTDRSYMGSFLSLPSSSTSLKRRRATSAPCESEEARCRKRSKGNSFVHDSIREEPEVEERTAPGNSSYKGKGKAKESDIVCTPAGCGEASGSAITTITEELTQELKCGCCTELCYNPVIVNPCQHFFCGSCCILWIRNGGTNCPACRSVSTSVAPFRVLQSMIDLLLRSDPSKARTDNERMQADQVYQLGSSIRLPLPRPATPEPVNDNFARPCPTCLPGNPYGWRCPIPIRDPVIDPEHAFDLDDGTPPGHAFCGNCDQLHNSQAPTSTKCDFCHDSFCGVGIQGRCCALGLLAQQPHNLTELPDIILNGSIYDSFQGNSVEVDILVDYLRINDINLRGVYKDIVAYTLRQPNPFMSLIENGVFDDIRAISASEDSDPLSPRRRICRLCAAQLFIHGIKEWWIRERKHGNVPENVLARKDCPQGSGCDRQNDPVHCKELNHIIGNSTATTVRDPQLPTPMSSNSLPSTHPSASAPLQPLGLTFRPSEADMSPLTPPRGYTSSNHDQVWEPLARAGVESTMGRTMVEESNDVFFDDPPAGPSSSRNAVTVVIPSRFSSTALPPIPHTPPEAGAVDTAMTHSRPIEWREERERERERERPIQQQPPVFGEEINEMLASKTSSSRPQALSPLPTL